MKPGLLSVAFLSLAFLAACDDRQPSSRPAGGSKSKVIAENIDGAEALEALRLQPVTDPVMDKIEAYRKQMADYFYAQKFDELEKEASAARASKEVFGNGSWKISEFYNAFERGNKDALGIWNVTEDTLMAWQKAFPDSVTARVAYADFLTHYAWHARGTGYAKTVSSEGWRLMEERLSQADEVLIDARKLPEKDPVLLPRCPPCCFGEGAGQVRLQKTYG